MTKYLGLQDIIDQVEKSLEDKNYIAALALALTIPDKCGKIEYPNSRVGERYSKWYNIWCHGDDPDTSEPQLPDANGSVIYQLRCAMLHDNSIELKYDDLEDKNKLDEFELEISDFNGIYSVFASGVFNDGESRHMRIRIIDLCKMICYGAGIYYKKNKEKVDKSSNIKIVDYRHLFKNE
jgi:hypothetical protein